MPRKIISPYSPPAKPPSYAQICRHCRQPLTASRSSGGSPGYSESDYLGPDGSDWCPGAGPYKTREEWKTQRFPTLREPNPDFSGFQYHNSLWVELAA